MAIEKNVPRRRSVGIADAQPEQRGHEAAGEDQHRQRRRCYRMRKTAVYAPIAKNAGVPKFT